MTCSPTNPRFVINATNMQTAALWRFSRNYMGDYRVGLTRKPNVSLAAAVAASSAFPPVPVAGDPAHRAAGREHARRRPAQGAFSLRRPFLSDGGVYDNLGLETITKRYKTLLVSDAGQKIAPEASPAYSTGRATR